MVNPPFGLATFQRAGCNFSGGKDIAEYDNGAAVGSPSREYIYAGGQLLATITGGPTPAMVYHHTDHLSIRVSTEGTTGSLTYGQVIGQQGHYPYGETWYAVKTTTTKFIFTSYERDGDRGLHYANFRCYDSHLDRFTWADLVEGWPADPSPASPELVVF